MDFKDNFRFIKRYLDHKKEHKIAKNPKLFYDYISSLKHDIDFQFNDEQPIFILSSSWRAGSTLLQRIVTSDANVLVWGEPYDKCNPVQSMSDMLRPLNASWPPSDYFRDDFSNLSDQWIANLYPNLEAMLHAHKAFLNTLFVEPAKKSGFTQWGLKEVRFGLKEILYLKLFFPNAKFLLLNRDLNDAFSSYRKFSKNMHWCDIWPNKPIYNAYKFAKHHKRLNNDFLTISSEFSDLIVDYNAMTTDENMLKAIDEHCNITCDRNVLIKKVGSGDDKSPKTSANLSIKDKALLYLGSI